MRQPIAIGSRGSDLALWQAHFLQDALTAEGQTSEIKIIKTQGDRIQHLSFDKMEGKGFFTKELEESLLKGEIDVAVHSYKDLETRGVPGLHIAASSYRAHPSDILLIRREAVDKQALFGLPNGAVVGTSSARRKMQIRHFRPDVALRDLRGNVPTRVNKLRTEPYDAIILARAGLDRLQLDLSEFETHTFDPTQFIPAPAQGVLAYQTRSEDTDATAILRVLHHADVADCIGLERRVLNLFHGGCQIPLGAYCTQVEGVYQLKAIVAHSWDSDPAVVSLSGDDPESVAQEAVHQLKSRLADFDLHKSR